jgi:hypothetical protein
LLKHRNVFSQDKNYIGLATNLKHKFDLKNKELTYRKQYPIPDAQRGKLEGQVKEWLKIRWIQPSRSKNNSPLFMVRVVQGFRELNAKSMDDRYSMEMKMSMNA